MTEPLAILDAPTHWRCIDIVADVHLQASQPEVLAAFAHFLRNSDAQAIVLLGDIFEVWVGDDAMDERVAGDRLSFEGECAALLAEAAARKPVFFMHGNRDFLIGAAFAQRTGVQLLADPCTLHWHGVPIVLSHGDALCLEDVPYQQFRAMSRSAPWQQAVLSRPLAERRALGQTIRAESQQRKSAAPHTSLGADASMVWADADAATAQQWLDAATSRLLIHGHTHRPADHTLPSGAVRCVLSDWHIDTRSQRTEVLRLGLDAQNAPHLERQPLPWPLPNL